MKYRIVKLPYTDPPAYTIERLDRTLFGKEKWRRCWTGGMHGECRYRNRNLNQVREDIASWERAEANIGGVVE